MKRGKMSLIPKIIVGCFAVYAVVNLLSLQLDINEAKKEEADLAVAVESQKRENEMLKESAEKTVDDELIAEEARAKLGLAAPGERVFVDISN